ncbi:MAG: hypothetical protein Q4F41_10420 [Eubacteriales bacterium]|nr:hypothetical protein [Eubacteriales bacterium]
MRKTRLTAAFFLLFLLLLPASTAQAASSKTRIHFICLNGSTDAILLESNGLFGMIDSGEDSDYPTGDDPRYPFRSGISTSAGYEDQVIAYLKKVGVTELEFYIGTHAHSDHIGSGDEILQAFPTKRLYLAKYSDSYISDENALWDNQYCYDNLIAAAKATGTKIIQTFRPTANHLFKLGDMTIEIMNYEREKDEDGSRIPQPDDNYNSLGVKVTAYGLTAFLGGDINNKGPGYDETALAKELGHVDLLKLGHHGYSGSNSSYYLETLSPDYAVITGSVSNLSLSTANLLNSMGTALYTTYGQPTKSAVIAEFSKSKKKLILTSPSKLTVQKTTTSSGSERLALFTSSGKQYTTQGWIYLNQNYYYIRANGYLLRSSWTTSGGQRYYLTKTGAMACDALRIKGKVWSFRSDGTVSTGGWTRGKYYYSYARSNGTALTGLRTINGSRYYFDQNGRMQTGWVKLNKKYYYFRSNGKMVVNRSLKIDGVVYTFNAKGVCTNY